MEKLLKLFSSLYLFFRFITANSGKYKQGIESTEAYIIVEKAR